MGLPHAGSYSFQSEKNEWSEGLKTLSFFINQSGTDDPTLELIGNTTPLDPNIVSTERKGTGEYWITINTTDTTLANKLTQGINSPTSLGKMFSFSKFYDGSGSGLGIIFYLEASSIYPNPFEKVDGQLEDRIITFYYKG